jgi:hypothetical protein
MDASYKAQPARWDKRARCCSIVAEWNLQMSKVKSLHSVPNAVKHQVVEEGFFVLFYGNEEQTQGLTYAK